MRPHHFEVEYYDMQAIETKWNGYTFRSRLEARYAVLFQALGFDWKYEPQGFSLNDGRRYLPDFYLPRLDLFVEVKGVEPGDETRRLLRDFKRPILLVVDLPEFGRLLPGGIDGTLFTFSVGETHRMPFISDAEISWCEECGTWAMDIQPESDKLHNRKCKLVVRRDDWEEWGPHCGHRYDLPLRRNGSSEIREATEKAKSARFEHGGAPDL